LNTVKEWEPLCRTVYWNVRRGAAGAMADDNLEIGLEAAWDALAEGVRNRRHGFHAFTLATVTPDGLADARTMILRGAERGERTLRFNLDARSPKAGQVKANPRVCCVFYAREEKLQVRAWGTLTLHLRDETTRAAWERLLPLSRETYRTPAGPGEDVDPAEVRAPLPLEDAYQNFVVCRVSLHALEWVRLAYGGNRRARYEWADDGSLTARWLAP
jgi:pyridoxamine 5'-phosphate oxidase